MIRDWFSPSEYPYGSAGGEAFLELVLALRDDQKDSQNKLRESLRDCYETIQCCLFPYPGKKVACSADFDGSLSEIDEDFVEQLKLFIPKIFGYSNLQVKKINGVDATGENCFEFLSTYVKMFNDSDELPDVSTMHESTQDNYFRKMVRKSLNIYIASATAELKEIKNVNGLVVLHGLRRKEALEYFLEKVKICNDLEKQAFHVKILLNDIELFHRKVKGFMEKIFRKKRFDETMSYIASAGKITAAVAAFAVLAFMKMSK